jgi:hypothetical protein
MAQAVARARWRRCFALSLAFRLFARIVLLDLAVLFTWGLERTSPKSRPKVAAEEDLGTSLRSFVHSSGPVWPSTAAGQSVGRAIAPPNLWASPCCRHTHCRGVLPWIP